MGAPFAAFAGYRAKLRIALQGTSTPQYITLPASEWYFPQRLNSRSIYSSAGGVFPDTLFANLLPSDALIAGRFRNDYNPFLQWPIFVGQRVVVSFDLNNDLSTPAIASIKALVTLIDSRAQADGQVSYAIGLRAMWRWLSFNGSIPGT